MRRHHRRHRWGRDAATGGHKYSMLASVLGFVAVPSAMGILGQSLSAGKPLTTATKTYALLHLVGLGASWYGQKKFSAAHSFLRGAMYGEGAAAALSVGSSVLTGSPSTQTTPELAAANNLMTKLVQSRFIKP